MRGLGVCGGCMWEVCVYEGLGVCGRCVCMRTWLYVGGVCV